MKNKTITLFLGSQAMSTRVPDSVLASIKNPDTHLLRLAMSSLGCHICMDIRIYFRCLLLKVTPVTETQKETSRINVQFQTECITHVM